MTTYYIRKTGSDSNAGTSAGAAWATIGKALGAAGIASGDTVYIGAGIYRELVTCNLTSPVAETKVVGDVDGSKTGDAGYIYWTAYTTNDKTGQAVSNCLQPNARDYLTFQNIIFVQNASASAGGSAVSATTPPSTNITFRNCVFLCGSRNGSSMVALTCAANIALIGPLTSAYFSWGRVTLFT